jgi:hypothetical protein
MSQGGIARVKEYPLSDGDMRKLLGENIKVQTYPQLGDYESIDEVFDDMGRAILLFPNASPTMGHWTCLINRPNKIEFFDPYGDAPEEQKEGLSKSRLEMLDIERPYLTKLLRASGKPVYYNNHAFQKNKASVATCGRHCAVRLLYAPYTINKYKSIIDKSGLSPDDFVSGITYDKLKK